MIYRLGRKPDPWSIPDWASAGPDGTFGNRFDDPEGMYRVLYASSQRLGCFLETLGRFRVDPKLLAELAEIEGEDDYCPLGEVPLEWGEKRVMGVATAGGGQAQQADRRRAVHYRDDRQKPCAIPFQKTQCSKPHRGNRRRKPQRPAPSLRIPPAIVRE